MTETAATPSQSAPVLSIAIMAGTEEDTIGTVMQSLLEQSVFARLWERKLRCEIFCLCRRSRDNTPLIARWFLEQELKERACSDLITGRCVEHHEPSAVACWNLFVHNLSHPQSKVLILMQSGIVFDDPSALWSLYLGLKLHPEAAVAVDHELTAMPSPVGGSIPDWVTLKISQSRQKEDVPMASQVYAIRSNVARNIYLPEELADDEDGFIRAIVCTDFLSHSAVPERVLLVAKATHHVLARSSLLAALRSRQRRMISRAIMHILIEDHLSHLSVSQRLHLAETIRREQEQDPAWLPRLIASHLRHTRHFWELIPGIMTFRFDDLGRRRLWRRILGLPDAVAGWLLNLAGCWMACHHLRHSVAIKRLSHQPQGFP